ncbi:retrotransposon protein, putative, ty1-copia subclass, partial [Tanacetum coccineum]
SARIPQVPDRYGYYVDVEEYELGDLDEPPNYKATLADPESDKWLEAMNTEIQSMKDNQFDIRAIRILLAITSFYDYEIWKIDVKTAFLNGHLSEDVYMNKRFDEEIKKIGFTQNPNKPYVYLKASGSNVAFLVLYVDDILLMGNSVTMLEEVKSWLCKCFSMKDLEEAAYIFEIKIICDRSKRLIALSQSAYLEKILKKFRKENSKKGYTPMMEKPDYRKSQGAKTPTEVQHMQRVPYASAIDMVLVYGAKPEEPEDELKSITVMLMPRNLLMAWRFLTIRYLKASNGRTDMSDNECIAIAVILEV